MGIHWDDRPYNKPGRQMPKWLGTLLAIAASVAMIATLASGIMALPVFASPAPLSGCRVVDGDTLRCGDERIRLLGIDAPEKGRCQPGRRCAPGDPIASEDSLRAAAAGPLTITRVGRDRYGRTLALVSGPRGDLACHQLRAGHAIYRTDWDNGRRLAAICRAAR